MLKFLNNPGIYKKSVKCIQNLTLNQSRILTSQKRLYNIAAEAEESYQKGQTLSGFMVQDVHRVNELQLSAIKLQHIGTGAEYIHIARDDSNNVFSVGFRTPPMNSTGVPHILEHTVLCGSAKYPCRDPFFKMLNRSLSTYMNALTGSDYTMYPFSTQHPIDFQNLMSIYLDATFYPNIKELDFLQEGWRLEHQNLDDKLSPLIFKGVVYNEMKGVFADPQMLFMRNTLNKLLPSGTYGHESGGDPLCIPKLSWKELKDFHSRHYHPSNSRFFTYGNFPLVHHLEFIHENYLMHFNKIDPNTTVPREPKWEAPRKVHIHCGAEPMASSEKQTSVGVSYVLSDNRKNFENFVLGIISELLIGGPNAPFYKSLLEPQIGSSFSPLTGFDNQTRDTTFSIGLQGVNKEDVDKVSMIIDNTFYDVVKNGFSNDRIEAILHNIELTIKHQTSNFGLGLIMSISPLWNHGGDVIGALEINKNVVNFRKKLEENPEFLQDKIKEYFIDNKHRLLISMSPEENYEKNLLKSEEDLLNKLTSKFSYDDYEKVWNLGKELKEKQELQEDISCLPTLKVSDLQCSVTGTSLQHLKLSNDVPLQVCLQPTNGVTYFRAIINTRNLPHEQKKLLPLLSDVLTKMGAGNLDYKDFDQKSVLVSGGLSSTINLIEHPNNMNAYEEGIVLSSHCLSKNIKPMLALWSLILNDVKLNDMSRFSTLVKMIATNLSNRLVYEGHSYAMSHSASFTSYVSHLRDDWGGFGYLQRMKEISEMENLEGVLSDLKTLVTHLFKDCHLRFALNLSSDDIDVSVKHMQDFLKDLNCQISSSEPLMPTMTSFTPNTCMNHHEFPFPINFASKSYPGVPYCHPDSGPLRVLARLMFKFLHREIREKGGAYGGGASYSPGEPFKFYSYRDPESIRTLKVFDDAIDWVIDKKFSGQDLDEAKIGVFQKLDAPIPPGSMGMRQFICHISDTDFNHHRCSVLDTNSYDLVRVAERYLQGAFIKGGCLIGPENNNLGSDWNVICH